MSKMSKDTPTVVSGVRNVCKMVGVLGRTKRVVLLHWRFGRGAYNTVVWKSYGRVMGRVKGVSRAKGGIHGWIRRIREALRFEVIFVRHELSLVLVCEPLPGS